MVVLTDYTEFLSVKGKNRKASPIRELTKFASNPEIISLGGGLPNPSTFPIKKLSFELKDGTEITLEGSDLDTALQYTPSYGVPKLLTCLTGLQKRIHKLDDPTTPGKEWAIEVTTGSQEGLALAIDTLLSSGDSIIVESPTYSGTLSILTPMSLNIVEVKVDGNGLIPSLLEDTLENWSTTQAGKPFPKILYTIPTGQNPAGCTLSIDRKKEIYRIASKYNLLILEDDPYYFLQFPDNDGNAIELPPSFISMDVERRVLRFDSFSKILSSGLRIGWITGPASLVERVQFAQQASTLHASGVSQTICFTLLNKWGVEGLNKHLLSVQRFYKDRRDKMVGFIRKHLGDLVEFDVPVAGMFLWVKLNGIPDSYPLIYKKAFEKKVIVVPGGDFSSSTEPSSYARISFSLATEEKMEEACIRLAHLIRDNQIIQS